jgi:hypothetical protein
MLRIPRSIKRSKVSAKDVEAITALRSRSMSKEKPNDDPGQRADWKNTKQTDEPWKGPVEKEQKRTGPAPDLEKWQETNTH